MYDKLYHITIMQHIKYTYGTIISTKENVQIATKALKNYVWFWQQPDNRSLAAICSLLFEAEEIRLGYYPNAHFDIVFVDNAHALHQKQIQLYNTIKYKSNPAFVSLSRNTMYVSVDRVSKAIIKHEFGHMLLHNMVNKKRLCSDFHEQANENAR